jgi:predicted secreted protein
MKVKQKNIQEKGKWNKKGKEEKNKAHLLKQEVVPLTSAHKPPTDCNAIRLPNPVISWLFWNRESSTTKLTHVRK